MPQFFKDLPFPIINRTRKEAATLRSINKAFYRIQWRENSTFVVNINQEKKIVKELTFKEICWAHFENKVLSQPWKTKWENILENTQIEWDKVWENVHDNMISYKVQSSLWMMINLNYISAFRLNRIYNTVNECSQCKRPEEGPAHTFLFCEVSNISFLISSL